MTVSNNWVNALRADEMDRMVRLTMAIADHKQEVAELQKEKRTISDRARKRLAKGVDKDSHSA